MYLQDQITEHIILETCAFTVWLFCVILAWNMGYQMPNFNENIEIRAFFESKGQVSFGGVTEIERRYYQSGFTPWNFFWKLFAVRMSFLDTCFLVYENLRNQRAPGILTAHCEVNTKVTISDSEQFYSVIKDLENLVILFSDF